MWHTHTHTHTKKAVEDEREGGSGMERERERERGFLPKIKKITGPYTDQNPGGEPFL